MKIKDLNPKKLVNLLQTFKTLNEIYINYSKELDEYFKDDKHITEHYHLYCLYINLKDNIEFHTSNCELVGESK